MGGWKIKKIQNQVYANKVLKVSWVYLAIILHSWVYIAKNLHSWVHIAVFLHSWVQINGYVYSQEKKGKNQKLVSTLSHLFALMSAK